MDAIGAWYEKQKHGAVWEDEPSLLSLPGGMASNGPILFLPGFGERLAGFAHYGANPVVWIGIPNHAIPVGLYRMIRDALLAVGAPLIAVPLNVLGAAEVDFDTIRPIDRRHTAAHLERGDEYLFTAGVHSRQARFLSGYDENEPVGRGYFMCELPQSARPTTVAEAYEALKPEAVKQAERHEMEVRRQGDMFFIRMGNRPPEEPETEPRMHWRREGDVFLVTWTNQPVAVSFSGLITGHKYLHNTNHTAERVRTENGLTFASGDIMHAPRGRAPDHVPLHLGTDWWLCVKNTVPTVR
ncbi:MAG TPA: hypothetical protein VIT65_10700 [Microlunatus sp.]